MRHECDATQILAGVAWLFTVSDTGHMCSLQCRCSPQPLPVVARVLAIGEEKRKFRVRLLLGTNIILEGRTVARYN